MRGVPRSRGTSWRLEGQGSVDIMVEGSTSQPGAVRA